MTLSRLLYKQLYNKQIHNSQEALKHLLSIVSIQWTRWGEEEGNQTTKVSLGKTEQLQSKALLFPIMRRMAWWWLGWGRFMVQCHSGLIASTPLEATANYFAIECKRILSDCRICIKASHDGLLHPDFSLNYSIICRGGFSVLPFVRSLSFSRSLPLSLSHDVNWFWSIWSLLHYTIIMTQLWRL